MNATTDTRQPVDGGHGGNDRPVVSGTARYRVVMVRHSCTVIGGFVARAGNRFLCDMVEVETTAGPRVKLMDETGRIRVPYIAKEELVCLS